MGEKDTFGGKVGVDCVVICPQCAVRDRGAAVHLCGRAAGGQQGGRVRNAPANVSCQHLARCCVATGFLNKQLLMPLEFDRFARLPICYVSADGGTQQVPSST